MYKLQNAQAGAYHVDMLRAQALRDSAGRVPSGRRTAAHGLTRRFRRAN